MALIPSQYRLLLVGARVARLLPHFTARGYVVDACQTGEQAMALMEQAPRHVLLLELELTDMMCSELMARARARNLAGAVILLEDPAKSGLIVSSMIRGIDGYVATPPDEGLLFRLVERQLLAQWALAQGEQEAAHQAARERAERALAQERAKLKDLVTEVGTLRSQVSELTRQLTEIRAARDAPITRPAWSASVADPAEAEPDAFTEETTTNAVTRTHLQTDILRPAGIDDGDFEEPRTTPGLPRTETPLAGAGMTRPKVVKAPASLDDDGLFLDLEDPSATRITPETPAGTKNAAGDDDLLNFDD